MVRVDVRMPGLLARFTAGERRVAVDAGTVRGAVESLARDHPDLQPHLFDDRGDLRAHLQVLHGGRPVGWTESDEEPVAAGDEVVVLQAVSGG